jgi:hypothetical protein
VESAKPVHAIGKAGVLVTETGRAFPLRCCGAAAGILPLVKDSAIENIAAEFAAVRFRRYWPRGDDGHRVVGDARREGVAGSGLARGPARGGTGRGVVGGDSEVLRAVF